MLYSLVFHVDGIIGPGGYVDESLLAVVEFVKPLARVALDQLGDAVSELEWFDTDGEVADPYAMLQSEVLEQTACVISQISDFMKPQGLGYLDLMEHESLRDLLDHHDVLSWCSESMRHAIAEFTSAERRLVSALADEWSRSL